MDRDGFTALRKLVLTVVLALAFLLLWRLWPNGPFSGLAAGTFFLVVGPVLILVLVETGRSIRRQNLGRAATLVSWLPQLMLGAVACVAGLGGLGFLALDTSSPTLLRLWAGFISLGALLFGLRLFRRVDSEGNRARD
jgi:hypothetical protein